MASLVRRVYIQQHSDCILCYSRGCPVLSFRVFILQYRQPDVVTRARKLKSERGYIREAFRACEEYLWMNKVSWKINTVIL